MRALKFAVAVGVTSVVLVAALGLVGVLVFRSAVANAAGIGGPPWMAGAAMAQGFGGQGIQLPSSLQGLKDVPPDQLFGHFGGVQVNLKDKNNNPITIAVTPGTVTAASAAGLTIDANDGTSKSFTLDANTAVREKSSQGSGQSAQPALTNGDKVVVVTASGEPAAMAVIDGGKNGFTPGQGAGPWGGPHGWWGH